MKHFKHASNDCREALQEIIAGLEKLETNWSLFALGNKIRFGQLVRYHVLHLCDIDLENLQVPANPHAFDK